ncbi:molybdenum cofactor guanylyltransferase [Pseudoalteromonas sp. T1lg75]|uniref:molybdenum cofactor guanylyltransferase n=1 Tax=Pseudoalteromonas sp. T1lg75 TaxID=2077102 RepID=UPI000CF66418|nr:molybdenum cofactor guanylyltransferase [Pseudoalteromonas sp. T1lg75]
MKHIGMVLAGGQSSRMGRDKAELTWRGGSLLNHSLKTLALSRAQELWVSRNKGKGIVDVYPKRGPLGGIHAVSREIQGNAWLTIIPVDMPLLNDRLISKLQAYSEEHDRAVCYEQCNLPCVIPLTQDTRDYLNKQLMTGQNCSIKALLNYLQAARLPLRNKEFLINTNTPQQWARLSEKEVSYVAFG